MPLRAAAFAGDPTLEACLDGGHRMLPPEAGQAVKTVQRALLTLGKPMPTTFAGAPLHDADGVFGQETADVVIQYKLEHGLTPADGVVGSGTMRALDDEILARESIPVSATGFADFAAQGRVDSDLGLLLHELHQYAPSSWALESAHFAHHELTNGSLAGIVRASNAAALKPFVPASQHGGLDGFAASGTPSNASTVTFDTGAGLSSYIVVADSLAADAAIGKASRNFLSIVLVHELTHFRNRGVAARFDSNTSTSTSDVVDAALAASHVGTHETRSRFINELACRHVAWRVLKDILLKSRAPTETQLQPGQLFHAASDFAFAGRSPAGDYADSGYMAALADRADGTDFRRQVALWLNLFDQYSFHDDADPNAFVHGIAAGEFAAAQPVFALPGPPADGLA